ncbi:MAG: glycoside hydrolase family 2 TIM barrel-domain containing protein [Candidatus Krumholzibacteriia bacterium]
MIPTRTRSSRAAALMAVGTTAFLLLSLLGALSAALAAGDDRVEPVVVVKDAKGMKLQVAGRDFMVFGMNWDYIPIGENYAYDFWGQSDEFIEAALATEMPLLRNMGINCIRQYVGIPPRWVEYIWKNYGIYTVLNHPVARWGATIDGVWVAVTDYSNPKLREQVKAEIAAEIEKFKDTPGVLMWLLGNENNYGLSWSSFEIEALPKGEQNAQRARFLYSLMGELIDLIHELDDKRPVSMANGDLQYLDIIAEECPNLDIFGTNQYRGISVGDMNQRVKDAMNIPLCYTEFGSDAYNARTMREDQVMQARYLIGQWREIYERSYGKGGVGNHIGGMIFQWSDGWWKYRQEERLDIHDTHASWPNGAYREDFVEGENNMNEEWWGICAKGPTDAQGHFELYPRAAYFALAQAFKLDPYAPGTDLAAIRADFAAVTPMTAMLEARGDQASLMAADQSKVRVSGLRMEFETFSTGGTVSTTPAAPIPGGGYPSFMGFDHLESYYVDIEAKPANNVIANLSVNILGNVPDNPVDEIFYENRGRKREIEADGQPYTYEGFDRVKAYQGSLNWDDKWFELNAFYRTGHLHWGFEGDFFGLYRNAFYGENIDILNGMAPIGAEVTFKKDLQGLKAAFGPQLWWGANPAIFLKYQRDVGRFAFTGIVQEDIGTGQASNTSSVQPTSENRKASLQAVTRHGQWTFEGGTLWSGSTRVGDEFRLYDDRDPRDIRVLQDRIKDADAWGFKGKVSLEKGAFRWYAQGAYMGLVADAGPTEVITLTGWSLKDSGSGNQKNVLSGFTYNVGDWQIGPNFLWQKPIVGPIPGSAPEDDAPELATPRNLLYDARTGTTTDPFAVIDNREMRACEILFTYDPSPATWFYAWDNDKREGARLAFNLGIVYKDMPTTRDAKVFYDVDGVTQYAFPGAAPGHTEWEIHSRIVGKLGQRTRLVANVYAGEAEPNGWVYAANDVATLDGTPADLTNRVLQERLNRIIHRYGADVRLLHGSLSLMGMIKFNDWGVYDYHRDWNYTYPVQLVGDVAWSLGQPQFFGLPDTKLGLRFLYRTLDQDSNRYRTPFDGTNYSSWRDLQNDIAAQGDGTEWEIRTYLHLAI